MARTTSGIMMSLGTVNMWGFSPSIDMQAGLQPSTVANCKEDEPLKVLLVSPGDIRHVLQTIANRRRHEYPTRPIHIYIYEHSVETLARNMLLFYITQDWSLPLRQRCNIFLEVFGNALVQERTSIYIEEKAKILTNLLHNEKGVLADQFDFSHLKMKTRDELVDTFGCWSRKVRFDVQTLRDHRLRHYYELRYDYRSNLIDWDYTMNLKRIDNASVIHIKQYREWRNTGIAFEFGDQTYTEPNRTMAAYTEAKKKQHGSVLCRGLWTDIIISPYISFGVDCDTHGNRFAEQLFEIHNKGTGVEQNRHNTTEVAVYNVLSYLYEIETGETYRMKKAHDVYSGINDDLNHQEELTRVEEVGNEEEEHAKVIGRRKAFERDAQQRAKTIVESLEGIKIIPLTGKLDDLYTKKRYEHAFDHVFLSSQHSHTLQTNDKEIALFTNILADNASVSIESSVFLLPLTEEQRLLYVSKLIEMTSAQGLEPTFPSLNTKADLLKLENAVLRFDYTRSNQLT